MTTFVAAAVVLVVVVIVVVSVLVMAVEVAVVIAMVVVVVAVELVVIIKITDDSAPIPQTLNYKLTFASQNKKIWPKRQILQNKLFE